MADPNRIVSVHYPRALLTVSGTTAFLFGINTLFMSYSKQTRHAHVVQPLWHREKPWQKVLLGISGCLLISSIVLLLLSVILYDQEKQTQAQSIAALAQQVRASKVDQSKVHEAAIIQGVASAIILCGLGLLLWNYHTTERFQITSILLYASGWITAAVAMSTNARGLSTIEPTRLAWTLPGAFLITAGTVAIPWEIDQPSLLGPSIATLATGLSALAIGHSYVTK